MKVNKKDGQILLKEEYLSVIFLSVLYNNTNSETADKVKRVCIILHWWTKRNTIRTIFHFPTCFCAINSNENSTLILFDSFCTTNYIIICAFLQIIINMVISLDK